MKIPSKQLINLSSDLLISRIVNGMWQVSGAHGKIDRDHAIESMLLHVKNGLITWDLADHYGPAEDFVKIFKKRLHQLEEELLEKTKFFTKWVPQPQKITKRKLKKQ